MPRRPVVGKIQRELRRLGDYEAASFLQKFFKTGPGGYGQGDRFRGIRVPVLRTLAKKYQDITLTEAEQLLRSPFHEDRLLALLILVGFYSEGDDNIRSKIYHLYLNNTRFINNWDLVDASAEYVVGAFLRDKDRMPLHVLTQSSNLWERRIAIMATFHFIKRADYADTFTIAGMLLNEREDLVHKAVGWMLREVGKRNLEAEEKFLKIHYRRMPRVMLRYAIERFPESKRRQYLRGVI